MGCWSESCAISGLEIGAYDEAVVMVLAPAKDDGYGHGAFCRFSPITPPTFGKYSDYGDIEGPEDNPEQLDSKFFTDWLEKGRRVYDPSTDDHMKYMANLWWCRKDVWDYCDNLPREFSYGDDNPDTIGELITQQRGKVLEYVKGQQEIQAMDDGDDAKLRRLLRSISSARDIFGLDRIDGDLVIQLKTSLDAAIEKNNQERIDDIIEAAMRVLKLSAIGHELRKIVCPSTRIGPQHGGYEAILSLNKFVVTKCHDHFAEYGEED